MRTLLLCMFLISLSVYPIKAAIYIPIDTANTDQRKKEVEVYAVAAKNYLKNNTETYKRGERSYMKKSSEARLKLIKEDMLKGEYVFDKRFDSMLTEIVDRILQSNPTIDKDIRFYVQRDISLNAYSLGNGRFIMNLGSFYYLENEEQLATIIAHEIGHFVLKHAEKDMVNDYALNHSEQMEDMVDDLNRNKYNKGERASNKVKEILYSKGQKNKVQELEADSLGYLIYRNAKYSSAEYVESLKLMAIYDTIRPKGLESTIYKKVFTIPKQPFKEAWMKREDFSAYDYTKYKEKYNEDSLKDHPEAELRIKALQRIYPEISTKGDTLPSSRFLKLQSVAAYEQVPSLYILEEYGGAIYVCLQHLQRNPEDLYHKKWLGTLLTKIAKARKEYTLNRYLDRIDPKNQSDSYQQFLSFMWNLSLAELNNLAEYYTEKES